MESAESVAITQGLDNVQIKFAEVSTSQGKMKDTRTVGQTASSNTSYMPPKSRLHIITHSHVRVTNN